MTQLSLAAPAYRPSRKPILWYELLAAVVAGLYPSDQHLEHMLDWLEQTP